MPNYWLFKTEPTEYSISDLDKEPGKTVRWDGIRNYQARNFLRDQVQTGDGVFIFHSSCRPAGIVGTARIHRGAYADPSQFNGDSPYYDPKSNEDRPRWFAVDLRLVEIFPDTFSTAMIKNNHRLAGMRLLKQGRLSIQPVSAEEWREILRAAHALKAQTPSAL